MERCNMFKCAMAFLWSLFIAFFILLCLTSCEYDQVITPDNEVIQIKLDYSLPFTSGSRSVEAEDVYDEYYDYDEKLDNSEKLMTIELAMAKLNYDLYNVSGDK